MVYRFFSFNVKKKFEWAWQHPENSLIFRTGMPNKSASLAKVFQSRRGIKAKLQLAQILLCECVPYKDEALTLYFFDEGCKDTFDSLFVRDSDMDDEEENLWCEKLPSHTSCQIVGGVNDLPFYASVQSKSKAKVPSGGDGESASSSDKNDDSSSCSKSCHNNNKEEEILRMQSLSIKESNVAQPSQQTASIGNDEVEEVVLDMTDGKGDASITSYCEVDTNSSEDTINLLSTPDRMIHNVVTDEMKYSFESEKEDKTLKHEGIDGAEDNSIIHLDLSFTELAFDHLSSSRKKMQNGSGSGIMTMSQDATYSFVEIESKGDIDDSDQTIDLCSL